MTGIKYMTDNKGRKRSVIIDLKKHGKIWEDFYDTLVIKQRVNEPRETIAEVKTRLKKSGKINAGV
jgi:hypothetical protein